MEVKSLNHVGRKKLIRVSLVSIKPEGRVRMGPTWLVCAAVDRIFTFVSSVTKRTGDIDREGGFGVVAISCSCMRILLHFSTKYVYYSPFASVRSSLLYSFLQVIGDRAHKHNSGLKSGWNHNSYGSSDIDKEPDTERDENNAKCFIIHCSLLFCIPKRRIVVCKTIPETRTIIPEV